MNLENLNKIATILETGNLPKNIGFNMNYWFWEDCNPTETEIPTHVEHSCGTVCCIGGLTNFIFGETPSENDSLLIAADHLGLNIVFAEHLFHPITISNWNVITPAQAAQVIRHLMKTGIVDWSIIEIEEDK